MLHGKKTEELVLAGEVPGGDYIRGRHRLYLFFLIRPC